MTAAPLTLTHDLTIAASPQSLFDLVADTEGAPRYAPTQVHAEVVSRDRKEDLVRRWVYDGRSIRSWQVRRVLDREALRIVFTHDTDPQSPVSGQRGEWTFAASGEGATLVTVTHTLEGDDAETLQGLAANLDRHLPGQLGTYKFVGELGENLSRLYLSGSDSVVVPGTVADVFARLLRPGTWSALDSEPTLASARPLSADTDFVGLAPASGLVAEEGPAETGYLRVALSDHELAYKRLDLPEDLHAELGRWSVTPAGPDKAEVTVRQSVTLNMNALASGVDAAREAGTARLRASLRRVLDAVVAD